LSSRRLAGPYASWRVWAQLPLGLAAGLPAPLCTTTLIAWQATAGADLRTLGLLSLIGLPYSLKFLWAPLFDSWRPRSPLGRLDRRRGAVVLCQGLLGLALLLLAGAPPGAVLPLALLVAFLSASQDLSVDAYRADVLRPEERAAGNATYVLGYRAALLFAGAGALILSEPLPWPAVYGLLAAVLLCTLPVTLLCPAPPAPPPDDVRPARLHAFAAPLRDLLSRPGILRLLLFVALYKVGETMVLNLSLPFLLGRGFSRADLGALHSGAGLGFTVLGALAGGALCARLPLMRALLLFGIGQALANLGYTALALLPPHRAGLLLVIAVDNLTGGLATAAFLSLLLSLCQPRHSAVQYALLSSLSGVAGRLASAAGGFLALHLGCPRFFALTALVALPALLLLRGITSAPAAAAPPTRTATPGSPAPGSPPG
jgi:PAT family beta-lactamase induction signal transducer AmpG